MLTLIGREIHDHLVYLVGLCSVTAMMIAILIVTAYEGMGMNYFPPIALLAVILLTGFCALGAAQMYGDRANRISPLLSTLAVTRSRILAARILAGVLAVLVSLIPLVVAVIVLLRAFELLPLAFRARMIVEVSITGVLTGLACYSMGLLIGWTTNKTRLLVGSMLSVLLLVSLLWIQGFGPGVMALLLLFLGAVLWCVWRTFMSVSL